MSKARTQAFKENIGSGFITYFRRGNGRMFFEYSRKYQERTHANLDAALSCGDLFVGYLSTYPKLSINHAVLVYAREKLRPGEELEHYLVYDPNHAEAPRQLTWSPRERAFSYQKDIDFIGGVASRYSDFLNPPPRQIFHLKPKPTPNKNTPTAAAPSPPPRAPSAPVLSPTPPRA